MEYESYVNSSRIAVSAAKSALAPLFRAVYEERVGEPLQQSLPDNSVTVERLDLGNFTAEADAGRREIYNISYCSRTISERFICENTDQFTGMGNEIIQHWENYFGTRDNPYELDKVDGLIENINDYLEFIFENPQLDDFIKVITDGHMRNAEKILAVSEGDISAGHELSGLFHNGDVEVIYRDPDMALLKPDYDIEGERVRLSDMGRAAYVVGVDDTPVGLFGHVVDGTNLDYDQIVSREMIYQVMGFDRNYQGQDELHIPYGDRVRLQGDLAIEKVSNQTSTTFEQCNVPIDNHLVIFENAAKVGRGSVEPVDVMVGTESTPLTVVHDEHEQVSCRISEGRYQLYLLDRGLQNPHPTW